MCSVFMKLVCMVMMSLGVPLSAQEDITQLEDTDTELYEDKGDEHEALAEEEPSYKEPAHQELTPEEIAFMQPSAPEQPEPSFPQPQTAESSSPVVAPEKKSDTTPKEEVPAQVEAQAVKSATPEQPQGTSPSQTPPVASDSTQAVTEGTQEGKTSTISASATASSEKTADAVGGIDTMNVSYDSKGNWLYKRFWWEQARKLYDGMTHKVKLVFDALSPFFVKRTDLDRQVFDEFYQKSGFDKGVLETTLDSLRETLEEKRKKLHELSEQDRDFLTKIETEQEELAQLRQATEAISKLDVAVDQAIALLNKQADLCRSYQEQALEHLYEIERELSDKKAKELFYQMKVLDDNIANIDAYIKGEFTRYFDALGSQAKEQVDKVITSLTTLKERGIDLKKHAQELQAKAEQEESEKKEAAEKAETQQSSIVRWISSAWNTLTGWISQGYSWIIKWWSSSKEQAPAETTEQAAVQQEITQARKQEQQEEESKIGHNNGRDKEDEAPLVSAQS